METKRKKKILNVIMVLLIALIAVGGFMIAKNSGILDDKESPAVVSEKSDQTDASEKADAGKDKKEEKKNTETAKNKDNDGDKEKAAKREKGSENSSPEKNDSSSNEKADKTDNSKKEDRKSENKPEQKRLSCTISINCKTILNHMDDLAAGKRKYVPSNGIILGTSYVEFKKGDSAYDITKKACRAAGIQIEAAYTPVYGSYYVEGINHLYEFDCGERSGWLYFVNGSKPSYGSSDYILKDGDSIVWQYTCTGN